MWSKTIFGFLLSMLLTMSLVLNFAYLAPIARDMYLFIGFVSFFLIWAGLMSYYYCCDNMKQAAKASLPTLLVSVVVNTLFYTGVLA